MLENLTRNWWIYAVRGVLAIVFGVLAFARPEQALAALVLLFGSYAMVDGFFAMFTGIASIRYFSHWWALVLEGVAGIVIGMLTFFYPSITAIVLLYFIAAWALITGIFEIVAAIQLRREITGEWMLVLGGLLSILFSVLLVVYPGAGAVSVVWVIAIYAIIFGTSEIILGFQMKGFRKDVLQKA